MWVRRLGETLADALSTFSLDVVGIVASYAMSGLAFTTHQTDEVRVYRDDGREWSYVRSIKGSGLSRAFGLVVHDGLLYVGSWESQPIRVFSISDGSYVRAIGSAVLKEPLGVTIVDVSDWPEQP